MCIKYIHYIFLYIALRFLTNVRKCPQETFVCRWCSTLQYIFWLSSIKAGLHDSTCYSRKTLVLVFNDKKHKHGTFHVPVSCIVWVRWKVCMMKSRRNTDWSWCLFIKHLLKYTKDSDRYFQSKWKDPTTWFALRLSKGKSEQLNKMNALHFCAFSSLYLAS